MIEQIKSLSYEEIKSKYGAYLERVVRYIKKHTVYSVHRCLLSLTQTRERGVWGSGIIG